uniref:basic salivary proline-rich protein 3-like n=1 Tax=Nyctereutes procyonoides TaxID=34880 RepID=UPI00244385AC|nr:basic salivary proline-rich protein 3-like [Nyctereutes procyonoides]
MHKSLVYTLRHFDMCIHPSHHHSGRGTELYRDTPWSLAPGLAGGRSATGSESTLREHRSHGKLRLWADARPGSADRAQVPALEARAGRPRAPRSAALWAARPPRVGASLLTPPGGAPCRRPGRARTHGPVGGERVTQSPEPRAATGKGQGLRSRKDSHLPFHFPPKDISLSFGGFPNYSFPQNRGTKGRRPFRWSAAAPSWPRGALPPGGPPEPRASRRLGVSASGSRRPGSGAPSSRPGPRVFARQRSVRATTRPPAPPGVRLFPGEPARPSCVWVWGDVAPTPGGRLGWAGLGWAGRKLAAPAQC